jgi:hypothetical protein
MRRHEKKGGRQEEVKKMKWLGEEEEKARKKIWTETKEPEKVMDEENVKRNKKLGREEKETEKREM